MKIGILTFHYSNNYGGVLQAYALQKIIQSLGYNVEIINYVPSNYKFNIINSLGINRNIFKNNYYRLLKKLYIFLKHKNIITRKFDEFRTNNMILSKQVDENSIKSILRKYDTVIVGSDQIWNPSQRNRDEYFLNYGESFCGSKISYAADSTTQDVNPENIDFIRKCLEDFDFITVRNNHSQNFVYSIIKRKPFIVADPTLLFDFQVSYIDKNIEGSGYILTYILGKEINGGNSEAIRKIKKLYPSMPIYSIKVPTMNFELDKYSDQVFYDLSPIEWISLFREAKFVYTDSYHGVLFSLKYHKPFIAYYSEKLRSTRFIDLKNIYPLDRCIVKSVDEIEISNYTVPNFSKIDQIIKEQKNNSIKILSKVLSNNDYFRTFQE